MRDMRAVAAGIAAAILTGVVVLSVYFGVVRPYLVPSAARPVPSCVTIPAGRWIYPIGSTGPVVADGVKITRDITCMTIAGRPLVEGTVMQEIGGIMVYTHGRLLYWSQYVTYPFKLPVGGSK